MKRFLVKGVAETKNGFALIITITLMILLSAIAVGLLSLSSITLRSSSADRGMREARSNARLSLMLALGELQELAGADTRITAPANSVAGQSSSPRQLTGAWKSWEGSDHDPSTGEPSAPDYGSKLQDGETSDSSSSGRFLGWLVSSAFENGATTPPDILSSADGDTRVTLLGTQMLDDADKVNVETSGLLDEDGEVSGRYAWWVQGDNTKALIEYDESNPESVEDWSQRLASFTRPYSEEFDIDNEENIEKAVSFDSLLFLRDSQDSATHQADFHDITNLSKGLLTNAATGGWKRDLSLFSEKYADGERSAWGTSLPSSGLSVFTLEPGSTHETGLTTSNGGYLYPWVSNDNISMTWASLADYASLYKKVETVSTGGSVSPFFRVTSSATNNSGDPDVQSHDQYTIVEPILARHQFILGYSSIRVGTTMNYRPLIATKPIAVYFNPYNVALDSSTFVSEQMVFTGETEAGRRDQSWPFKFQATLKGITYNVDRTRQFLGARNDEGMLLQTWFTPLSRMTRANLFTGVNYRWKPGESKVIGVAERELEGDIPLVSPNNITRIMTGYDNVEAYKIYLDSSTNTGWSIQAMRSNKPTFTATDTIRVSINYSDKAGSDLTLPVIGRRDDSSLDDPANDDNMTPNERAITTVYDNGNLSETLPLPSIQESPRLSEMEYLSNPPTPFLTFSLGLRNLIDTNVKTKGYISHKQLIPLDFTEENIADTDASHSVYDWNIKSLSGTSDVNLFTDAPGVSSDTDTSAYLGTSERSDLGVNRWSITELPTQPLVSLCQLQHYDPAFLNYHYPLVANAIGNSHATPFISPAEVRVSGTNGLDHSYVANHLLWDDWFVSSIAPETDDYRVTTDLDTIFTEFLSGDGELRNTAYERATNYTTAEAGDVVDEYKDDGESWEDVASELVVNGMFNINSTSVKAWTALLKSQLLNRPVYQQINPSADGTSPEVVDDGDDIASISRVTLNSDEDSSEGGAQNLVTAPQEWDEASLERLAELIVEQVQLRGPFLSLSEFMNRQLSTDEDLAIAGAVEAAMINISEGGGANPYDSIQSEYSGGEFQAESHDTYVFSRAGEGHVLYGTPGWARQADIMRPLAPVLSVRDDTFTIRAYGDSRQANGEVLARAWCEAVVIRSADYVDGSNESTDRVDDLSDLNLQMGRKFRIVSFRWLSENEI